MTTIFLKTLGRAFGQWFCCPFPVGRFVEGELQRLVEELFRKLEDQGFSDRFTCDWLEPTKASRCWSGKRLFQGVGTRWFLRSVFEIQQDTLESIGVSSHRLILLSRHYFPLLEVESLEVQRPLSQGLRSSVRRYERPCLLMFSSDYISNF